jgi:hypothetical protein
MHLLHAIEMHGQLTLEMSSTEIDLKPASQWC